MHDCRGEIFRDSSKELFNDKMYNAERIEKYIPNGWRGDPDIVGERNVCND